MLSNTVSYLPKWFNFLLFYYIILIFTLPYDAYMKTSALTSHNSSFYFVFSKTWFIIIISNITTSQTTSHLWLVLLLYKGGTGNHINTGVVMTIPPLLAQCFSIKARILQFILHIFKWNTSTNKIVYLRSSNNENTVCIVRLFDQEPYSYTHEFSSRTFEILICYVTERIVKNLSAFSIVYCHQIKFLWELNTEFMFEEE